MVATGTARGPLMPPRRRPRLPLAPALMPVPTPMLMVLPLRLWSLCRSLWCLPLRQEVR